MKKQEIWDSNRFAPDVIVVNLGTNDMSFTRGKVDRIEQFKKEYYKFLYYVRKHNKDASILCVLGVMGQDLCKSIEEVVDKYSEVNNDSNIYYMTLELQRDEDGIGVDWHPSEDTHKKISNSVVDKIKQIKNW